MAVSDLCCVKSTTKTKNRPDGDKIHKNWIDVYQNVLFETKWCLNMIRFLILVSKLTFLDFVILGVFFSKNISLENGIFKICLRQSAKCKMTAQTRRKYHVFVKICYLECILPSKRRFFSSDPFCVFSI